MPTSFWYSVEETVNTGSSMRAPSHDAAAGRLTGSRLGGRSRHQRAVSSLLVYALRASAHARALEPGGRPRLASISDGVSRSAWLATRHIAPK